MSDRLKILKEIGVVESSSLSLINRTLLLDIQKRIQEELRSSPTPPKPLFRASSAQNAALKLYHSIELMQTQGINALRNYFQRMGNEALSKSGSKASRDILKDSNVLEALAYAKSLDIEHPKIPEIVKIVKVYIIINETMYARNIIYGDVSENKISTTIIAIIIIANGIHSRICLYMFFIFVYFSIFSIFSILFKISLTIFSYFEPGATFFITRKFR